jgi:beta-galactosidase
MATRKMLTRSLLVLAAIFLAAASASQAASVWVEGESPTSVSPAGFKTEVGNGPNWVLSDGKWLSLSLEAAKMASFPDDGATLQYAIPVTEAGDYDVWFHLGFEQVRAAFDWRIDNGPWQHQLPTDYTVDLQELGTWAPVAWLKGDKQSLTAGNHTLDIRIPKPEKNAKGKYDDKRFALDVIHLASPGWHPDGTIKPGDSSWQTARDTAAAQKAFDLPADAPAAQTSVSLAGDWQYAGDDEFVVDDRLGPTKSIPSADGFNWHAIKVPGSRSETMPHEEYVHRFYLRARLNVPAQLNGRSFVLHCPAIDTMATAFVNGQQVGFTKNTGAVWDLDLTKAIKPGQVNELWLAVKDPFYALGNDDNKEHPHYVPYGFWHFNLTNQLQLPILSHYQTGFHLGAPSLVIGGGAYTADVFAKTSVSKHELGLEITLTNTAANPTTVSVSNEVVPAKGGAAEKTFAAKDVTLQAGETQVVNLAEPWANPKLWWPDSPELYNVITRLTVNGQVIDQRSTRFGFREVGWAGKDFTLNGVPWHTWAIAQGGSVAEVKARGQNIVRVWASDANTEQYLNDCDEQGMLVRRTGIFDGEGAAGFYDVNRPELWDNYRQQMVAWMKGQRNHPSIFIWSTENEISFINGHVTGNDAVTTRESKKTLDFLQQVDATRPYMTDGGNAGLDESLEVYGGHYMEPAFNTLPEGAYGREGMAHRQVWPVTQDKPILLGEAAYVNGNDAAEFATVGGERSLVGKAEARDGMVTFLDMLAQGYRWSGINYHFWIGELPTRYQRTWAPVAVLCRQWDWTFGSGQKVKRTLGIFNNTHSASPITLQWTLSIDGKPAGQGGEVHNVAVGGEEKFDVEIPVPTVAQRAEGKFELKLTRDGQTVYQNSEDVSVLPTATLSSKLASLPPFAVYDPQGTVLKYLQAAHAKAQSVDSPDPAKLPAGVKVLLIGPGALKASDSTQTALAAWASDGHVAIVLEQQNPLKFQALPGQMDIATNHGCIGFMEDAENPVVAGLKDKDFFCWGGDDYLYSNAYVKPTSGGRSIIQCDTKLANTALAEMYSGKGLLLLSQLLIGEKIETSPVAQTLLTNLLSYGQSYQQVFRPTVAITGENRPLATAIDNIGVKYTKAEDATAVLSQPGSIAVINATPAVLESLAGKLDQVHAFTQGGGWLVLNNVTPDGLSSFNKLVGVEHIMRPFHAEKVTWPAVRDPLTAGISSGSIAADTGRRIFDFQAGNYPDDKGYTYVVDLDDVAPFGTSTYYKWGNAINGFTQADGAWQLIENLAPDKAVMPIKLPRPEKLKQITWVSDTNYEGTTAIVVTINGKDYRFATEPDGSPQTFDFADQPTTDQLTVRVADWTHDPHKVGGNGQELVGIDNIYLKADRSDDFMQKVKPMLNIGAMVHYPQGQGGIILANLNYRDHEEVPENVKKKQEVLAGILRNLKAPFSGGKTVIPGMAGLQFTPITLAGKTNQFRDERGWFGDRNHTFADLPTGTQHFGGVTYDVYHFTTSPVPEAIMLGGNGVPGHLPQSVTDIAVKQKADALFFLQTARIDRALSKEEIRDKKNPVLAEYVVHYADGKTVNVPIGLETAVANYRQEGAVKDLPGAQTAWVGDYTDGSHAVAYSMQWNNPRPDVAIAGIDLVAGKDHRGVPALLALTAATTP